MKAKTTPKQRPAPRKRSACALAILLCGASTLGTAPAQTPPSPAAGAVALASASQLDEKALTLADAVQRAVLKNPGILSRFHAIKAAEGERDAAKGGLYPRVDLQGSTGAERRSSVVGTYNRSWATLSLTQLLWDGRATVGEIARLDHASRVRVFELLAEAENVALEVSRAYYDVLRYRELVRLAENNFVEHRAVFAQTEQRVKAKVARAVDLEQITGRLALSEANLVIETSNLHDTSARFQRLVGRLPTREMPAPTLLQHNLPSTLPDALRITQERNASILAAIENVRAADAALQTRSGANHPRVEFRLKRDQGRNLEGIPGNTNATVAEILLNWNLFNGNADKARDRQFAEQTNIAREVRDKTCQDTRQTTLIAFNDSGKLLDQTQYLLVHEASLNRAMEAYRNQFQIGQRTLLDLLDTENELFQARRAVVNARYDLHSAYARSHASIGSLLKVLEVNGPQTGWESELSTWSSGALAAQQCPPDPVQAYTIDKDALVQRALEQVGRQSAEIRAALAARAAASGAAGASAATAPSVPVVDAAGPATSARAVAAREKAVGEALQAWRDAWARRDVAAYLQAYAPGFNPAKGITRDAWEKKRKAVIGQAKDITLEFTDLKVTSPAVGEAQTVFTQNYRSASYQDRVRKTMDWRFMDGRWQIIREASDTP